ncbi:MAG: hypothetical protein OXU19_08720, partial [bacterium]|nr:hypothetical protein [bacterium]
QLVDQHFLDLGLYSQAVDRPVEHEEREPAFLRKPGDEGRGLPVALRLAHAQTPAPSARLWVRVMPFLAQASSMKTRRAGSMPSVGLCRRHVLAEMPDHELRSLPQALRPQC